MPDFKSRFYPETKLGGFSRVDGTIAFYTRVQALISPSATVLDVGCGRGDCRHESADMRRRLRELSPPARKVIGIDIDPESAHNPFIDEFRLLDAETPQWPLADASTDVILCDWVLEHLEDPATLFSEANRTLSSEGYLCIRTTNRLGYVGLISSLLPNSLHTRIANPARDIRDSPDTHPTRYRCNTIGRLRSALHAHGFHGYVYSHEAEPSYLNFSRLAYASGVLYQRLSPRYFGNTLFAFARKSAI